MHQDAPKNAPAPPARTKNRSLPPNLTRRAHTKSRGGCIICRRRHIRCDQARPECRNCKAKPGLDCEYPFAPRDALVKQQTRPSHEPASPFSWQDMQALHHFLVYCPPALPLGNLEVWTKNVPQLAYEQQQLMHAILALGSSHLSQLTGCTKSAIQALQYRGNALIGLKEMVARPGTWSRAEVDAVLATCYTLMFQTSHIPDSIPEYMTLIKGCAIVTEHVRGNNLSTTFNVSTHRARDKLDASLTPLLADCEYQDLILEASQAMDQLLPYIIDPAEVEFAFALRETLRSFDKGLAYGLSVDVDMYSLWYHLGEAYLKVFLAPNNTVAKIVLSYFLSVQVVMHILFPWRWWPNLVRASPPGNLLVEIIQWIEACDDSMNGAMSAQLAWPKSITRRVPLELQAGISNGCIPLSTNAKTKYLQTMHRNAHVVLGDILRLAAQLASWFESILHLQIGRLGIGTPARSNIDGDIPVEQYIVPPPHNDGRIRELHRRINVFVETLGDDSEFPSSSVAEAFLRLDWS